MFVIVVFYSKGHDMFLISVHGSIVQPREIVLGTIRSLQSQKGRTFVSSGFPRAMPPTILVAWNNAPCRFSGVLWSRIDVVFINSLFLAPSPIPKSGFPVPKGRIFRTGNDSFYSQNARKSVGRVESLNVHFVFVFLSVVDGSICSHSVQMSPFIFVILLRC